MSDTAIVPGVPAAAETRGDAPASAPRDATVTPRDQGSAQRAGEVCDHDEAPGYVDHKQAHLKRLRRIEGQTRGLQRMIENDDYCLDVLTQISAVTSALKSLSLSMLDEHLAHCVAHAVQAGGDEADQKLAEANAAIARLVRS